MSPLESDDASHPKDHAHAPRQSIVKTHYVILEGLQAHIHPIMCLQLNGAARAEDWGQSYSYSTMSNEHHETMRDIDTCSDQGMSPHMNSHRKYRATSTVGIAFSDGGC